MTTDPVKSIPEFYAGQSIFLTGATGFLGKAFIEKILRSCPDVREIFLLMRPKKGLNTNQRIEKILNLPLFDKLREKKLLNIKKLVPISGDVSEKELGLSATDRQMLVERVTIIIHAAASVRFNNSLKYAIFVNTRATRDICILAQVAPSMEEPIPGWIDNIYGPGGLTIGAGKGILRVLYMNKYICEDVVPIDIVIKAVLVVIWKLGLSKSTAGSTTFVLNCVNQKHVTYQFFNGIFRSIADEIPLERTVGLVSVTYVNNFILFYILTILLHIMPAMLVDLILKLSGRRSMLVRLVRKLYVTNSAVHYFISRDWKHNNTNRLYLTSLIPPENRDLFSFDYSSYDFREYCKNCAIGGKKFVLHEDVNRMDAAKAHNKRMHLFVRLVKMIISVGVLWMIYRCLFAKKP